MELIHRYLRTRHFQSKNYISLEMGVKTKNFPDF